MGEHTGILLYVRMYVLWLSTTIHTYMAVLECGGCHHREITDVGELTSPPSSQPWKYHTTHIQGQLMDDITLAPSTCDLQKSRLEDKEQWQTLQPSMYIRIYMLTLVNEDRFRYIPDKKACT